MKKNFTILAIDTSCDDTSAAVTRDDRVLSNVISSQVEFHKEYGGVYPMLAKRKHQEFIDPAIREALRRSRVIWKDINALAVTAGPGLAPALEVGILRVKGLAKEQGKSVIAVNHMEAHLLSSFARNSQGQGAFSEAEPRFPILGLLVSGGHTQLVWMKNFGDYRLLGETLDDAAGEAFDKVAKMLGLGYPGGPIISELAKTGQPKYELPVAMVNSGDLNFSFSGLKTACLYKLQKLSRPWDKQFYCDFAASFEKVLVESLMIKLRRAIKSYRPKQIVLGGGVINNLRLKKEARRVARQFNLKVFLPYDDKLLTDNAAMVSVCAWH
ncbi:MAG: tRNA (adenosine(37)-N6)-threonylcarbamoyltransferase complex transferase subunit TsaD, partial [Candidatus Nealsonbacteria bacterium]|nr:tRNA (adenosine(37)-N6)-threonylcarbamoyltransferase complex transferase subunit TsaD [Candidatus Nealsonbacteria bacterium]